MGQRDRGTGLTLASMVVAFLATSPLEGQTFPLDPVDEQTFVLQWEKPFLDGGGGLTGWSSIIEVDLVIPVGSLGSLSVGAPLSVSGTDVSASNSESTTHVYVGGLRATLLFGEPTAPTGFLGVTLPTAGAIAGDDLGLLFPLITWLNEREKWVHDAVSVRGAFMPSGALGGGGRIGLRLGGALILLNGGDNLDADLRIAGWMRRPAGSAELRADLSGTYSVTNDDGFRQQTTLYLNLGTDFTEASGRPGVFLRLPLYGLASEIHQFSIGLKVGL